MKKVLLLLVVMLFIVSCGSTPETQPVIDTEPSDEPTTDWKDIPLADVQTGETYSISDFSGKPVLIESFAVWCPLCTRQQHSIKQLHDDVGDAVISVSLNTDPNEDSDLVKNHAKSNGFDWKYSISPVKLTRALIDEFGSSVVNAPSVPVILVCPDQSSRLLARGVKSADELKTQIGLGC